MSEEFALDSRLAADTFVVGETPLSQVLLMNDARYHWLILVPWRCAVTEPFELSEADQAQLWSHRHVLQTFLARHDAAVALLQRSVSTAGGRADVASTQTALPLIRASRPTGICEAATIVISSSTRQTPSGATPRLRAIKSCATHRRWPSSTLPRDTQSTRHARRPTSKRACSAGRPLRCYSAYLVCGQCRGEDAVPSGVFH